MPKSNSENKKLYISNIFLFAVSYAAIQASIYTRHYPLGHDESVYALRGRDLLVSWENLSGSYWSAYRAPGLSIVESVFFRLFGESDFMARLPIELFGLLLLVACWLIAIELSDVTVARCSTILLLLASPFIKSSSMALADVAGASVSALMIYGVIRMRERIDFRKISIWVLALGLIATLLRFGSFIFYGPGVFFALLLVDHKNGWNISRRINHKNLLILLSAISSFMVLYFSRFLSLTDSSPYAANAAMMHLKNLGASEGINSFIKLIVPWSSRSTWIDPWLFYVFASLVAVALSDLFKKKPYSELAIFSLSSGVTSLALIIFGIGLVEPNYLVLTIPFWAMLGGIGAAKIINRINLKLRSKRKVGNLLFGISLGLATLINVNNISYAASVLPINQELQVGGVSIANSNSSDCIIISTYTQSAWYSGCRISPWYVPNSVANYEAFNNISDPEQLDELINELIKQNLSRSAGQIYESDIDEIKIYALTIPGGKRQPIDKVLDSRQDLLQDQTKFGEYVNIYRVNPCVKNLTCKSEY